MTRTSPGFFSLRRCTAADCRELSARGLRLADRLEAERLLGIPAGLALELSVKASDLAIAVLIDGEVRGAFGVGCASVSHGSYGPYVGGAYVGAPWMAGCDGLDAPAARPLLARAVRRFVRRWLAHYDWLENLADPQNTAAVRFLEWLGFGFDRAAPVKGASGHIFIRFRQEGAGRALCAGSKRFYRQPEG